MIYIRFKEFFTQSMKRHFRLFAALPLLITNLSTASANDTAPLSARKQIYAAAQSHTASLIRQEARRKRWPDYQAKMNIFIPAEASQYRSCSQKLAVSHYGGETPDFYRLRLNVSCNDRQGWETAVTVKPDIYLPVIIAKTALERDQVLSEEDVTTKKININSTRGEYLTQVDDVVGMTVKRRIRDRQPITKHQLDMPLLVERGQRVIMVAVQNGVEARTVGEAMKKGRKGETINVKNQSSGKVVTAVVTERGVVQTVNDSTL